MKPHITIELIADDLLGEVGSPLDSPLALAMSRVTGVTFRHSGSILYTTNPETSMVTYIYDFGMDARTLWREWAVQRVPLTQREFTGKLLPFSASVVSVELTPEGKLPPAAPFRPYEEQPPIPQGVHAS